MKKGMRKCVEITLICRAAPPESNKRSEMTNIFMSIESAKRWEIELAEKLISDGYHFIEFEWRYKAIYR